MIAKWIDRHSVMLIFLKWPGKYLTGNLSGYVRFRVGSYCIIGQVDDEDFILMNVHVAMHSDVYKFKEKDLELSFLQEFFQLALS